MNADHENLAGGVDDIARECVPQYEADPVFEALIELCTRARRASLEGEL